MTSLVAVAVVIVLIGWCLKFSCCCSCCLRFDAVVVVAVVVAPFNFTSVPKIVFSFSLIPFQLIQWIFQTLGKRGAEENLWLTGCQIYNYF